MYFKGATLGFMAGHGYYSSEQAKNQVKRMKETGVEWVCVVITVWQEKFYSTVQFIDVELSPSDDEIIGIIGEILFEHGALGDRLGVIFGEVFTYKRIKDFPSAVSDLVDIA